MSDDQPPFRLEISFDGVTWRPMPKGYRQSGMILERVDRVVKQSIGRGNVVYYRAVAAGPGEPAA